MATLVCHPATPSDAVRAIEAHVHRSTAGELHLRYLIRGDVSQVRVPPSAAPGAVERLWEHTCCELFVSPEGEGGYREFNFSPSGQWAAYAFERYREGKATAISDPGIRVRVGADALELDARVHVGVGRLRAGLSAVIEEAGGRRSYWALAHHDEKPDFHRSEAFVLVLA